MYLSLSVDFIQFRSKYLQLKCYEINRAERKLCKRAEGHDRRKSESYKLRTVWSNERLSALAAICSLAFKGTGYYTDESPLTFTETSK